MIQTFMPVSIDVVAIVEGRQGLFKTEDHETASRKREQSSAGD